jgi:hypothetical protein
MNRFDVLEKNKKYIIKRLGLFSIKATGILGAFVDFTVTEILVTLGVR